VYIVIPSSASQCQNVSKFGSSLSNYVRDAELGIKDKEIASEAVCEDDRRVKVPGLHFQVALIHMGTCTLFRRLRYTP
jgi:hypothetical protein